MTAIVSRLTISDYFQIIGALLLLLIEHILRIILSFFPYSFADWLRFNTIGKFPRVFIWNKSEMKQRDTITMIKGAGLNIEQHGVLTHDGFLLIMHRIPAKSNGKPVLLMHGCMMSSEVFVCSGSKSLAFVLHEAGFDVWLGNVRGNTYSSKHKVYMTSDPEYWDFSLDELALIDVPAMVDHVLLITGESTLSYVGFSQGSAIGIAALSLNSNLNKKISHFVGLASTTRAGKFENPLVQTLMKSSPQLIYLLFGRKSHLSLTIFWQRILSKKAYRYFLESAMGSLFGWKMLNIHSPEDQFVYHHLYSYTSVKLINHWFQIINNGFQMMNDSEMLNGYTTSILYPISQISCRMSLFYGLKDSLCDLKSLKSLGEKVQYFPINSYEHLDFLWAKNVETVYDQVIEILKP